MVYQHRHHKLQLYWLKTEASGVNRAERARSEAEYCRFCGLRFADGQARGEIVVVSWIRSDSILAQPLAKIHFLSEGLAVFELGQYLWLRFHPEVARWGPEVSSKAHFKSSMSLLDSEMLYAWGCEWRIRTFFGTREFFARNLGPSFRVISNGTEGSSFLKGSYICDSGLSLLMLIDLLNTKYFIF